MIYLLFINILFHKLTNSKLLAIEFKNKTIVNYNLSLKLKSTDKIYLYKIFCNELSQPHQVPAIIQMQYNVASPYTHTPTHRGWGLGQPLQVVLGGVGLEGAGPRDWNALQRCTKPPPSLHPSLNKPCNILRDNTTPIPK